MISKKIKDHVICFTKNYFDHNFNSFKYLEIKSQFKLIKFHTISQTEDVLMMTDLFPIDPNNDCIVFNKINY